MVMTLFRDSSRPGAAVHALAASAGSIGVVKLEMQTTTPDCKVTLLGLAGISVSRVATHATGYFFDAAANADVLFFAAPGTTSGSSVLYGVSIPVGTGTPVLVSPAAGVAVPDFRVTAVQAVSATECAYQGLAVATGQVWCFHLFIFFFFLFFF
jgi:hypothetical protein